MPKSGLIGLDVGAPLGAVAQESRGLQLVRVAGGADVDAQVCFEALADAAGFGEVDQAAGEVSVLRPGGQPDGQPPGGDVVDGTVPAVGCSETVLDQALVQGKVGERAVLRKAVRPSCPGSGTAVAVGMVHACWVWLVSRLLPGLAVGWRVPAGG